MIARLMPVPCRTGTCQFAGAPVPASAPLRIFRGARWLRIAEIKKPRSVLRGSGYCSSIWSGRLRRGYVSSLQPLRSFLNLEVHCLTLGQGLETITFNCREVYKDIFTAIGRCNKAEAFGFVKPFNGTCSHVNNL